MQRAIIYARVSTEEQVERYGLPAQLRACRDYAASRGWSIVAEIADEGITGAILNRPGLERVRQLVREQAADIVLALDPDRLSRELSHLLILKPEIEKRAKLEFVTVAFEDTPTGRLFFSMKGAIAEYEREVTRDRTMRGKRERARGGRLVGGRVPFGYRCLEGLLIPEESRAGMVQQMYCWYDAGLSLRQITKRLRETGVPTWKGAAWGHSSVRRILSSETYAGVAYWGGATRIALPVPSLVDRELWQRVQDRLRQNPHNGRPSANYLLRGVLYCACGQKMYGEGSRRDARVYRFYRCRGRDKIDFDGRCRALVNSARLDSAVWEQLVATLTDGAALRALLQEQEASLRTVEPDQIERLRAKARKLRAKESTALAMMLDPDLVADRAEIKRRYREAQQERATVEGEIASLERAAAPRSLDWIEDTIALFERQLPKLDDPELRQRFVRGLVSRADWQNGELTMQLFLATKLGTPLQQSGHFPGLQLTLNVRLAA